MAEEDFIKTIKAKVLADQEYWQDNYDEAEKDAKFLSGDKFAQWNEKDYNARVNQQLPALTVDQLSQFVHQVANDIRINTPTINIIPTGSESDVYTAEVYKGLIKNIEYISNADNAYDTGALNAIRTGIGFLRVDHDYVDDESFDQHIIIKRVVNPLCCWIDKNSIEIDGRDANHGTILDEISVKEFKRLYPDFEPVCFTEDNGKVSDDNETIKIAEHFYIDKQTVTVGATPDGSVVELADGQKAEKTRKVTKRTVKRVKLSGRDILEETTFPGMFIPLIPVYGEELWINGERQLLSLIRKSKDAQRMHNYHKSVWAELLMNAPKGTWVAPAGQIENYIESWTNPHKSKLLQFDAMDINGNPYPQAPQFVPPAQVPAAFITAAQSSVDDIKATMGMYNASLGQRSNEQSGVAINARKQEGDVATFHFSDNLYKSVCQLGRVIVSMIPIIYDTPRLLQIIGMEEEPKIIGVNGMLAEEQEHPIDLTKGKYDVKVVAGASYTTLRQEAMSALQTTFQAAPELMNVMGDLYFKNADFAGAQAMAERMKKVIDPKFLDEEDDQPQIDPEKEQMKAIIQEGQQAITEMQKEMENLQGQLQNKQADTLLKAQEIEIKKDSLALDVYKTKSEIEIKQAELQADLIKAKLEAKVQLSPDVAMSDPELNGGVSPIAEMMAQFAQSIQSGLETVAMSQAAGNQAVLEALTKPKQVIRDETGKIAGVV